MVLLFTISFSSFNNLNNYKINSFLKQITSDMRYIKRVNQLGNNNVYIFFCKENGKEGYTLRENGVNIKSVYLPRGARLGYSIGKIVFNKNGTFYNKGTTISVKSKDKITKITITPVSGRILLIEGIYDEK